MFRIFNFISLITVLFFVTFTSCKKEELDRPDNTIIVEDNDVIVEGISWVLSDGRIYLENIDTDEKFVYDHFSSNRVESYLDIFGGSPVRMDSVRKDYTTWFFSNGKFTINGVLTYDYTTYRNVLTPIGLETGTSRPIEVLSLTNNVMVVRVHDAYKSHGGVNYGFYSELVFVKAGTSCNNCQPDVHYGYTYSGVWNVETTNDNTLVGTKWVVTKIYKNYANEYPNDTLDFVTTNTYTINGGSERNYTLNGIIGNNMMDLNLYSFTTLNGDFSGSVINTFIDDGEINGAQFIDMYNTNVQALVWVTKID